MTVYHKLLSPYSFPTLFTSFSDSLLIGTRDSRVDKVELIVTVLRISWAIFRHAHRTTFPTPQSSASHRSTMQNGLIYHTYQKRSVTSSLLSVEICHIYFGPSIPFNDIEEKSYLFYNGFHLHYHKDGREKKRREEEKLPGDVRAGSQQYPTHGSRTISSDSGV